MEAPITCAVDFGLSTQVLTLEPERFAVRAVRGKRVSTKADFPLGSLQGFVLDTSAKPDPLLPFDAILVLGWTDERGRTKVERLGIRRADPAFRQLLAALRARCPGADLTELGVREGLARLGVSSARERNNRLVLAVAVILVTVLVLALVDAL